MLRRFFGFEKPASPPPKMEEVQEALQDKIQSVSEQIAKIESRLIEIAQKIKSGSNQSDLKRTACNLLNQKNLLQKYLSSLSNQAASITSVQSTLSTLETNMLVAKSLKVECNAAKEYTKKMESIQKEFNTTIPEVKALQEKNENFQNLLSAGFTSDIDDLDVEAEFNELLNSTKTVKSLQDQELDEFLSKLSTVPKNMIEPNSNQ